MRSHACKSLKKISTLAKSFAAFVIGIAGSNVQAQSVWDGGGTTNDWSDGQNWTSNVAPSSAASTDVQMSGTTRLSSNVDSAYTLNSLSFNAGAGAFTLGGSAISISSASGQPARIINSSTNTQVINNALNLSGVGVATYAGDMTINGGIAFGGNGFRLISGAGKTLTINGVISGAVTADVFAVNATGNVVFGNSANTYTGVTSIWNGTVVAMGNAPAAFSPGGSGVFGNSGSVISLGIGSSNLNPAVLTGGAYTISRGFQVANTGAASTFTLGGNSSATSVFSGTILNGQASAAARSLTLTAASGGRVNFTGNIQRATGATGSADDLLKVGAGVVSLSGNNNTFSGITTVSAGTLLINGVLTSGGGAVNVNSGASLGGAGTINRVVSVNGGGTLSPGDMSGASSLTGILSVNGGVNLNNDSALAATLSGTLAGSLYDQLSVASGNTITLTGTNNLILTLGYTPAIGDQFTLVDVGGTGESNTLGTFDLLNGVVTDLSQGAEFVLGGNQFRISYTAEGTVFSGAGNNIMLQVVPEPSSALFLCSGISMWLCLVRRKAKKA